MILKNPVSLEAKNEGEKIKGFSSRKFFKKENISRKIKMKKIM